MKIETAKFGTIIQNALSGKYVLPRFQRNFKWRKDKISKLLESIYKKYPMGSVMTSQRSIDLMYIASVVVPSKKAIILENQHLRLDSNSSMIPDQSLNWNGTVVQYS